MSIMSWTEYIYSQIMISCYNNLNNYWLLPAFPNKSLFILHTCSNPLLRLSLWHHRIRQYCTRITNHNIFNKIRFIIIITYNMHMTCVSFHRTSVNENVHHLFYAKISPSPENTFVFAHRFSLSAAHSFAVCVLLLLYYYVTWSSPVRDTVQSNRKRFNIILL